MTAVTGVPLELYGESVAQDRVELKRTTPKELPRSFEGSVATRHAYPTEALWFEADVWTDNHTDTPRNERERMATDVALMSGALQLRRWIHDMVFAANLASPGAAAIQGGAIVRRRREVDTLAAEYQEDLWAASEVTKQLGWPQLRRLDVLQTWDWLKRQPGFRLRFGGGPTGRALNALTKISSGTHDPGAEIMWALLGLEALFTRGRGDLLQQLRESVGTFLGDASRAAKIISNMYEIRSRFIHGDLDFLGDDALGDAWMSFGNPDDEALSRAKYVATAILLAAVQELVVRDWPGVRFSTVCSPTSA